MTPGQIVCLAPGTLEVGNADRSLPIEGRVIRVERSMRERGVIRFSSGRVAVVVVIERRGSQYRVRLPYGHLETQEMLCNGEAVCSHKAYLIANILSEAGFEARIVGLADHAWAEARMPDAQGHIQTWIIDPGFNRVSLFEEVRAIAASDPTSIAAEYYTHPNRRPALQETTEHGQRRERQRVWE